MNSEKQPTAPLWIRIFLPICSIGSVVAGLLSFSGVRFAFPCLIVLFGLTYLLLYLWRFQDSIQGKQKAPGRTGRPGA